MKKLPPGPAGGLTGLRHLGPIRKDLIGFISQIASDFGDAATYRVGPVRLYQFSHPDLAHKLLLEKAGSFRKLRRIRDVFRRWLGEGLLISEGEAWTRQRKLVQKVVQAERLSSVSETVARRAAGVIANWDRELEIVEAFDRLHFEIFAELIFGREFLESRPGVADGMLAEVTTIQDHGRRQLLAPVMLPDWTPTPANQRFRAALRSFGGRFAEAIAVRRTSPERYDDLLGALLQVRDEDGQGLSDRLVQDEAINLLLGGRDTMPTALAWTAFLVAQHQNAQSAVTEEIDEVLGARRATADDAPRLVRTASLFQESMRLYPPVYSIVREAIEDVEIGGYSLRRGSQAYVAVYPMHRDPRWFDQPEAFQPDRFAPDQPRPRHFAYLPFGGGPRVCIGQAMGMLEGVLLLATLLQQRRLELAPDQAHPAFDPQISLAPRGGIRLRLERRAASQLAPPVVRQSHASRFP
jgi:cytochrome P450